MERKNTVLLTVIAVATLLVAVVGATFAYFTATNSSDGAGGTASTTTATVGGTKLTLSDAGNKTFLDYPGGAGYSGTKITLSKVSSDDDTNNYKATFDLTLTVTNGTGTDLDWKLYKFDGQAHAGAFTLSCTLESEQNGSDTHYFYDTCNHETLFADGSEVASGKISAGASAEEITKSTVPGLGSQTLETDVNSATASYYLVVSYENKEEPQNDSDAGKQISFSISGVSNVNAEVKKA